MAIPARFIDELKHRVSLSDVVSKKVKLIRRGKEHTGLCPFHSEKTPSFTVNDQKGFFHCFGCGEHGTAIDFVMKTDGLGFRDAVEGLAHLAGMQMPEESAEDIKRAKERVSLAEVMDQVASWYQAQLAARVGAGAADYVQRRGLKQSTIDHFRLGYAPAGRTALKDAMLARGVPEADLIETGMLIKPEDGGASYDRFRDRLMFPILDRSSRIVAFGGRALSKDAKAKYLNSPETTLFHKGSNLYNFPHARKAAFDTGQLLVVEGYMDVIALVEAGIRPVVAPLGTALTEEQIAHLWAMCDEPVLAFDGDKAGFRAATRAMERALPMLRAGKSLSFLLLDDGEDPDDMVRRSGREAMERKIDEARPLVDLLWETLIDGVDASTPERRAGLEKKIFGTLAEIADEGLKKLYQQEFRNRLYERFRPQRQGQAGGYRSAYKGQPMAGMRRGLSDLQARMALKATEYATGSADAMVTKRLERIIALTLLNHPEILVRYEEKVATLAFNDGEADDLRSKILMVAAEGHALDRAALEPHLRNQGAGSAMDRLRQDQNLKRFWPAQEDAALSDALTSFEHVMARFEHITILKEDYRRAEADFVADMTEESQARFLAAQQAYRDAEAKEASIDGFGVESNKLSGF